MSRPVKLESIYVDMDALMDTRLGTLHTHNSELAANVVASGTYYTRLSDEFAGIDRETFKELYSKRDNIVLKNSTITNVVYLLRHLVDNFISQAITRPYHDGCRLYINVYPYNLTDEERAAIRSALDHWLLQIIDIEFINLNTTMLTPAYCKNLFAIMIKYEYEEWFNTHAAAFEKCILPEVYLYAPAIYFNKKPTDTELEEIMKKSKHPMKAIEALASPIIGLRLFDAELFSIIKIK